MAITACLLTLGNWFDMTEQLKQHVAQMDDDELVRVIYETVKGLKKSRASVNKASETERLTPIHASRAKRTTVYANTEKNMKVYRDFSEQLKFLVSHL